MYRRAALLRKWKGNKQLAIRRMNQQIANHSMVLNMHVNSWKTYRHPCDYYAIKKTTKTINELWEARNKLQWRPTTYD